MLELEQNLKDLVDGKDLLEEGGLGALAAAVLLDGVVFDGETSSEDVSSASERMTRALFDAVVDKTADHVDRAGLKFCQRRLRIRRQVHQVLAGVFESFCHSLIEKDAAILEIFSQSKQ